MKHHFNFTLVIFLVCSISGCSKKSDTVNHQVPPKLSILSIDKNTATYNDQITISGTGFSTTISDDKVYFNGIQANVTSATSTTITVLVPQNVGTGKITITVSGVTATGPVFTYSVPVVPLTITSLSTSQGVTETQVVITGTGFNTNIASNLVFFNGVAATVIAATSTTITTIVPQNAGTGKVTVTIRGTTAYGPIFNYNYYTVSTYAGSIQGNADGSSTTAAFNHPRSLVIDAAGNIYVADMNNNSIRKIAPNGTVSTLAGNGKAGYADGVGKAAMFNTPSGITVDDAGIVYVADTFNSRIRKITADGTVTTVAGNENESSVDGKGKNASFNKPRSLVYDKVSNSIYVANGLSSNIRKIDMGGVVTTIANGFYLVEQIAVDPLGNIIFGSDLYRLSKITPTGSSIFSSGASLGESDGPISTASFGAPTGLCTDAAGNIFITEFYGLIRKIDTSGMVTTIAGAISSGSRELINGNAEDARFNYPYGITVDKQGNLYVADYGNSVIRKLTIH